MSTVTTIEDTVVSISDNGNTTNITSADTKHLSLHSYQVIVPTTVSNRTNRQVKDILYSLVGQEYSYGLTSHAYDVIMEDIKSNAGNSEELESSVEEAELSFLHKPFIDIVNSVISLIIEKSETDSSIKLHSGYTITNFSTHSIGIDNQREVVSITFVTKPIQ